MQNKNFSIFFLYFWISLFGIIPFLMMLLTSFMTTDPNHLFTLPFTLENYKSLYDQVFINVFLRSIVVAFLTTFFCLLIAYPFTFFLVKSKKRSLLILFIMIPFWTSSLVRTYSLLAIIKFKGLLNFILLKLHWISEPLSVLYTNHAVIMGLVYTLFPFMVLPLYANMERFDFNLIEAAQDLGASKLKIFFSVFLPNTKAGITAGCLLVMLPATTLFYIPNLLGGAHAMLIGNLIQTQFLVFENWPAGAASSIALTGFMLLVVAIYKAFYKESRP